MSRLNVLRGALVATRDGAMTFDALGRLALPHLRARGEYFLRKWTPQLVVDADDLAAEMLLELRAAIAAWDPTQLDLVEYVDGRLGRCAQRSIRRALRWPDKRRSKTAQQADVGDDLESMMEPHAATQEAVVGNREQVESFVDDLPRRGWMRLVVRLVVDGVDVDRAAVMAYESPSVRKMYGLRDVEDARRRARRAVRRATEIALDAAE